MNIEYVFWDKALFEFARVPPGERRKNRRDEWRRVSVDYDADEDRIWFRTNLPHPEGRAMLLTRPKLVRLTPWDMVWEASYWSQRLRKGSKLVLIPVKVTLTF